MTITLFSADDGNGNVELWSTDGTTGRTLRLADINPGAAGSNPANTGSNFDPDHTPAFAVLNGIAYFSADDSVHGRELWRSDGTAAGTVAVTDFTGSTAGVPNGYSPNNILVANNLLFFNGNGPSGFGVYSSTGVAGSTPTFLGTQVGGTSGFVSAGNYVYWFAETGLSTSGLYATNGGAITKVTSDHNTTGFIDVNGTGYLIATGVGGNALTRVVGTTPTAVSGAPTSIAHYINANGVLYFTSLSHNGTLYSTNPSITTTTTVKTGLDFNFVNNAAFSMAALGSHLVFTSTDATHGIELWFSDGTSGGTVFLKDILPGTATQFLNNQPANLTTVGNTVFFQDGDGKGGIDLWKTDGTGAGTVLVKHIESANIGGNGVQMAQNLTNMSAQGNLLMFAANDGVHGTQVWRSDGTAAGTFAVKNIDNAVQLNAGIDTAVQTNAVSLGGVTYFMGTEQAHGNELWSTDGTLAGTHLLKDISPGFVNSNPGALTLLGSGFIFTANDGSHGSELWVSDGTAGGTHMVSDIRPGAGSSNIFGMTQAFGSSVLFAADDGVHGSELWISNGTAAGTLMLADISPGGSGGVPFSSGPFGFTTVGSQVFFQASTNGSGNELWVTDGTPGGTHVTKDIRPGPTDSGVNLTPSQGTVAVLGSNIYFTADDGTHGTEVWMSNGSNAGTVLLKDVNTGAATSSNPHALAVANGHLFFIADNGGVNGPQLWVSDGTAGNASQLTNTQWNFSLQTLTAAGPDIFFTGFTSAAGTELYVTNGGAVVLIDIAAGATGSNPSNLTAMGGTVFFSADDGSGHGTELWSSNVSTTHMVKDLNPGSASSNPGNLTVVGSQIYFTASDATHGQELWVSDGTSGAGTHMVRDIAPGVTNGGIFNIKADGAGVTFYANDGVHGTEVWISDGSAAGTIMLTDAVNPLGANPGAFTALPGIQGGGPETLTGTPDNDYLTGLGGNDTMSGLAGDDILIGGTGNDTIDGGTGNDTAVYAGSYTQYIFGPTGGTNITVQDMGSGSFEGTDTLTNVETLKFSDAVVTFDFDNVKPWLILATAFDPQGSVTSTSVTGHNGGQWVNSVDTNNSTPVLWGTQHFDNNGHLLETTTTNDDGTHLLTVYDAANQYSWANATVVYDAAWNQIGLFGVRDDASTTITMTEIAPALDTLQWYPTPYNMNTGAGPVDVSLSGGGNTDVLFGYDGNDTLNGGGGNDQLTGGTGNDVLTGGGGDDTFHFRIGDGNDTITDFVAGAGSNDLIDLHGYGVASFAALQGLMTQVGADTLIALDPDNHLLLQNVTMGTLTSGDFLLS
jgi:ELWxxDGT repeat protein